MSPRICRDRQEFARIHATADKLKSGAAPLFLTFYLDTLGELVRAVPRKGVVSGVNLHRGRWQAQGNDIKKLGGYSTKWDSGIAPTKEECLALLHDLSTLCLEHERKLRETACRKAKRFVENAPLEGISATGTNKSFYVRPWSKKYRNARIDLEILAGMAFKGQRK
jgi:hypothetical protein